MLSAQINSADISASTAALAVLRSREAFVLTNFDGTPTCGHPPRARAVKSLS
jgi:hypothetical protein